MFCPECDIDFDTTAAAVAHEDATGHPVAHLPVPDFWDLVDAEYARHVEDR